MIDRVKEKIGEEMKKDEIHQSHRLGAPKNNGKSRPIIMKFARYNTRCRIFKNKKKIEEENIRVTEGLTKKSMESLKKAKEDHGFEKVGSSEAKIFYKDVNDRNKTNIYFD